MIGQTDSVGRSKGSSGVGGVPQASKAQREALVYLTAEQVRKRYGGVHAVTLLRWTDNPELGFPRPIKIGRRNFWSVADLEAFEQSNKAA